MATRTISGTYGGSRTPCEIFVFDNWYCVEGSCNVNHAPDADVLTDGVDVETIMDTDHFNWKNEIESEEELEMAVNS